jgi:hypothetical protein
MEMNGATAAALIGIYATLALDSYSAFCSSPQTTEINIDTREDSLMYWVKMGGAFGIGAGVLATMISGEPWPLIGATTVSVLLWLMYKHAATRGRKNPGPSTED